ncbi:hypothetical protein [Stenotrophomonas maltophilia]|uniref:hypothetical protein n=1 Tax=Stenotrophomonas maltophilia TaxID=40324 RepID=UPI002E786FC9|nr:hypothetical protein [Stenotrophomonas maltophilia]
MSKNYEGIGDALTDMNLRIARLELTTVALLKELAEAKTLSTGFPNFLQRNTEEHAARSSASYFQELPALMAQWTQLVSEIQGRDAPK